MSSSSLLFAVILSLSAQGAPVEPPPTFVYDIDPAVQAVAAGSMGALLLITNLAIKPSLTQAPTCRLNALGYCDEFALNPLDRSVVGNHSQAWRLTSDMGQIVGVALPAVASVLDLWLSGTPSLGKAIASDTVVIYNSVLAATLATHTLKFAVRRPRPPQYSPNAPGGLEQQASFPSGHASATAAATTAYATTFALRHPNSRWRYAVYAAAFALTAVTSYGRVAAGRHFYTDILGGMAIGGAVGFTMPYLNRYMDAAQ